MPVEENGGLPKGGPVQFLAAAAAIGLKLPLQGGLTAGTDRRTVQQAGGRAADHRRYLHGRAVCELVQGMGDTQQLVGGLLQAGADLFQGGDGGGGPLADDVAKVAGTDAAKLGGGFIAELFGPADAEDGTG